MRIRALIPSDVPLLKQWALSSGFPYIEPEDALVVVDDSNKPLMACAPRTIIELYLWVDPANHPPAAKLHAMRMLHDVMGPFIKQQGYDEVNAFLPPQIEKKFGRRLMRSFQWIKNWPSYCKRL